MVATYSTSNKFTLQGTGDNINTWGGILNTQVFALIDESLDGVFAVTITGNAAVSLTIVNGTASVASTGATQQVGRARTLLIQGVRTVTHTLTVPAAAKWWDFVDQTTGAGTVVVTTGAGTTATLVQSRRTLCYCDATNVVSTEMRLDQVDVPTASVSLNSQKITNLATGTAGGDAVNFAQMVNAIATATTPGVPGTVLVSITDPSAGYIGGVTPKLTATAGIVITQTGTATTSQGLAFTADLTVLQTLITATNFPLALIQPQEGWLTSPIRLRDALNNLSYMNQSLLTNH